MHRPHHTADAGRLSEAAAMTPIGQRVVSVALTVAFTFAVMGLLAPASADVERSVDVGSTPATDVAPTDTPSTAFVAAAPPTTRPYRPSTSGPTMAAADPVPTEVDPAMLTVDEVEQVARHALNTAAYVRLVDGTYDGRTTIDGVPHPSTLTKATGDAGRVTLTVALHESGDVVVVSVDHRVYRDLLDGHRRAHQVTAEPSTSIEHRP
ncbi:MAG: hypothetical protein AAGD35_23265 [Actinomycetota bacterium]